MSAGYEHAPQDSSLYAKWVEAGAAFQAGALPAIVRIGNASTDGTLTIRRDNSSGDGRYEAAIQKDGAQIGVVEPSAVVAMDDEVEFLVTMSYDPVAEEITLSAHISVNGAPIVSASTTISDSYPSAYTGEVIEFGLLGATKILDVWQDRGVRTMPEMRAA